jgi:hypothetical protein
MVTKTVEWVSITALLIVASCQHKGRLGQDLVKAFVHKYASLNPEDARSHPTMHLFVGEERLALKNSLLKIRGD